MMRWQPRRCGGRTTVLWAHLAAWGPAADGAEEEATSHRTAPRRGRPEAEEMVTRAAPRRDRMEAEEKTAGAGATAAGCMVGLRGGGEGWTGRSREHSDAATNRICGGSPCTATRLFVVLTFLCGRVEIFMRTFKILYVIMFLYKIICSIQIL